MAVTNLRHYIHTGDWITYSSTKAAYTATDAGRSPGAEIPCTARVIAVYCDFAVTQLRVVQDCANRWEIEAVNGNRNWAREV